jgi:hypothetical protein
MSFLWNGISHEIHQGENKCKECIDKSKRLVDYDLFFNELQNVLKKKDGEISELQSQLNEINTINENTEFSLITLNAHKGRLERELEKQKEFFQLEKKKWIEDKLAWENIQSKIHEELILFREMNTNLTNQLDELEDEKLTWKHQKKVLDEKIENLTTKIEDSENKIDALIANINKKEEEEKQYQERIDELSENFELSEQQYLALAKKYTKDMEIKEEEFKEKELDLISMYRERIESLEEALEEKEQIWQTREEEYEFMIQRYQENEDEYELKIQELKYETSYELDKIQNAYQKKEEESLTFWENRIDELNRNYDDEFLLFSEKLKTREQILSQEKESLEFDLKKEIEELKLKNKELEHYLENDKKQKVEMTLELRGLRSDNEWLEMQWNEEQEQIQRLKNEKEDLVDSQKKMEMELLNLKEEMFKNQKNLEEVLSKETQTNQEMLFCSEEQIDLDGQKENNIEASDKVDLITSCIQGGLRKRNMKHPKKNFNHFIHPSTYEMEKSETPISNEKKTNLKRKRYNHPKSQIHPFE